MRKNEYSLKGFMSIFQGSTKNEEPKEKETSKSNDKNNKKIK
jgi:hypothetical protein